MVARDNWWLHSLHAPYMPPTCPLHAPYVPQLVSDWLIFLNVPTTANQIMPPLGPLCTPYAPPTHPIHAPMCPYVPPTCPLHTPYVPLHAPYMPSTCPLCAPMCPLCPPIAPLCTPYAPVCTPYVPPMCHSRRFCIEPRHTINLRQFFQIYSFIAFKTSSEFLSSKT